MSILERLRERFWFIPAVLCLAAVVLAEALVTIDERMGTLDVPGWLATVLYRVGESGSRDILGAIATSSLAVAGTTFSITMAVLALTSSTYGPRLVRNFMTDRGNQTVLGVYVSTFLYSLLVLRSIRVLGDPGAQDAEVFVPHLAVNAAVVLAVANVVVLIYFIHHITESIQVSSLAGGVRRDLRQVVDRMYPADVGRGPESARDHSSAAATGPRARLPESLGREGRAVTADRPGYVQHVEDERLLDAARDADVVVALQVRPGDYVLDGTVVALVHPPGRVDDDVMAAVRHAVAVADARTPVQDVAFAVQQLTEMAVRALSPGTNDPYTAVNAVHDLTAGLSVLASRRVPSADRLDAAGVLRVHAPRPEATELIGTVVDHMRWYAASSPAVMHATLDLLRDVAAHARSAELRAGSAVHVALLRDAFHDAGHHVRDVRSFDEHADSVLDAMRSARPPAAGSSR
ncbi:DUF2254 domain-containing protein [uncultured Cellulomonas sp.]|uniref:DUF2254 domain-containing protein n=1 Tax=uncultured Cellulomonas sp. TaxID=189682 RepID=UPI0026243F44|nr:DUF2254 domain-containing protein [uncultured Cellulomonas sp.]